MLSPWHLFGNGFFMSGFSLESKPVIKRFKSAIALPGFNPFGQVFVQLNIVWHLNTEKKFLNFPSLSV